MGTDEFTKLFQHMHRIEVKLDGQSDVMATKNDIDQILKRLDSIEKQLEISEDERLVMGHQLDRVNRWVKAVADKIDYTLTV